MTFAQKYNLQQADIIIEPLFQTGITKHYAVYLGMDANGIEWIAENHKFSNVHIITATEYFQKAKSIDRIKKFDGSESERRSAVERALNLAGKPYNLVLYNCEHYASEVWSGKAESKQVRNALFSVFGFLFLAALFTNSKNN